MSRLAKLGGGASLFPLGVLFAIELLDQATQSAFNVLTPNIRDAFHLTNAGILLIVAIAGAAALACTLPIAVLADRTNRVRIALVGALVGAAFSIGLGVAQGVVVATIMLVGVSMGQAVIFPTHNSLLADYYPVPARPRVYSAHRSGISIGAIVGVLLGAGLAAVFSWRAPFFFFAVPIVVVVIIGLRLREPVRGRHEQLELSEQMLASERGEPAPLDDLPAAARVPPTGRVARASRPPPLDIPVEAPPSLGEAWRTVWKIGVLRRIFIALPFLAAAIAGFTSLASLQYQETFHLDAVQRAYLIAPIQLFDLLGLAVGAVIATRLARRGIGLVFRMLAVASMVAAGFAVLFALAPNVPLAFIGNAGIDASLAIVGPGVLASLSLAIPARVRSVGFSIGALFVLPGFLVLPAVGALGDAVGFRYGLLILVPIFVIGGLIVASAGSLIERDVRDVWTSMRTRTQMLLDRHAGRLPLLAVRELAVGYDGVVVLADVAIEIAEGEIVALVGTNGAGKSTLLRAIGGVVEADHGAIVFDGRDITHLPPDEIARLGVAQVPGGEGIFPNLRVEDNLRVAAWQGRRRGEHDADMIDEALTAFPSLASRRDERAANLSGGQQQMLALAMATITRPKLFLIDELSLGLSPIVVEQLLGAIESMRQAGTSILLVEQSMNVAVAVADRVYVMETGVVRFSGSADELAAHPEMLWSVYLQKASETLGAQALAPAAAAAAEHRPPDRARGARHLAQLRRQRRPQRRVAARRARRDRRHHRAQRRRQDHALRRHLRLPPPRLRAGRSRRRRHHRPHGVGPGPAGPGPLLPGLAPVLGPHRPRRPGRVARAVHRRGRPVQRHAAPAAAGADRGRRPRSASTSSSTCSASTATPTTWSASCRPAPGAWSTWPRVVAHQPSVVLLDEPSSGVAQREVEAMVGLLRSVRDRLDATLLVVEHDIAFIAELADRLVAMDRGAVLLSGPPHDVLESPVVGEAFLGSDPLALSRSARCGAGAMPAPARRPRPRRWTPHERHRGGPRNAPGGPGRRSACCAGPGRSSSSSPRSWPPASRPPCTRTRAPRRPARRARRARPPVGHATVPLTYAAAAKLGKTAAYNWGPECDHHTGRLKIPSVYSPPCVPVPAAGASNGGATSEWRDRAAPSTSSTTRCSRVGWPRRSRVRPAPTPRASPPPRPTWPCSTRLYELYGRHINLIPFTASGADTDPVAAHADAVTVAQQLHAFASISGPGETNAYEDELARLHVLCMACGDSAHQRADPTERPVPVGQPAHGRHLALRDGRRTCWPS